MTTNIKTIQLNVHSCEFHNTYLQKKLNRTWQQHVPN